MKTPDRYNPVMVTLHWLTVILLLSAGLLADGEGSAPINIHMVIGALLLIVLVVRLILRFTLRRPAWADTGNLFLNKLGELVHVGLYVFAFMILGFGAMMASQQNLLAYAIGSGAASNIEPSFIYSALHQLGWLGVISLLVLHVGGALYHQFIIKDHLLKRMWYTA